MKMKLRDVIKVELKEISPAICYLFHASTIALWVPNNDTE